MIMISIMLITISLIIIIISLDEYIIPFIILISRIIFFDHDIYLGMLKDCFMVGELKVKDSTYKQFITMLKDKCICKYKYTEQDIYYISDKSDSDDLYIGCEMIVVDNILYKFTLFEYIKVKLYLNKLFNTLPLNMEGDR